MRFTLSDALIGLMLLTLTGTAAVTAAVGQREVANRAACAQNLHRIGLGILLYQNDNRQQYPRTVMGDPTAPVPTWGTPYSDDGAKPGPTPGVNPLDAKSAVQPKPNDVTAGLFLVLRTEMLTPEMFICPSTKDTPFDYGGGKHDAGEWVNWPGKTGIAKHLSFSYTNPYASNGAVMTGFNLKNPDATFAVAGDINPGGKAELAATPKDPPAKLKGANSPNHMGDGQNVLFGDGHVAFNATPFCGTNHDDIYTAGGPEIKGDGRGTAKFAASSVDANDSVLLPTAADVRVPAGK